ncbi:MAG: nucleoside triphosphate pyrophosphohydrolase [Bdellovibrionales bacterium]|nr:nucleoside triphosphate pyrophosphohydrolase [Bdellovibrionales bacterium]
MKPVPDDLRSFASLVQIMKSLRSPEGGCPWDLEQTHQTLVQYAIEEVFELTEAIENKNLKNLVEELGDVLLQVVFHSELGRQENRFDINDVIEGICTKLVTRHPHVFGDVKVDGSKDVLKNWDEIKKKEKRERSDTEFGIPKHLPALQRAHKIGVKTESAKFDWPDVAGVFHKVKEELAEVEETLATQNQDRQEDEIGDLLFAVSQLARHLKLDPEQSLRRANRKFETRFFQMQKIVKSRGLEWNTLTLEQKEDLWREVKLG